MSGHNHYSSFMASLYDTALHIPIRRLRKSVVQIIKDAQANRVVDLCCGTGNQILYLKKAGISEVMGVDVSENMLRQAWGRGLRDICLQMDATQTTFKDYEFDVAIMSFSLHEMHADTALKVFLESKRIVKPGGLLIVVDYSFDEHTKPLGRFAARAVEKFVGGDHYRNFKNFMSNDLLSEFSDGLSVREKKRFLFGAVGLWVFLNNSE